MFVGGMVPCMQTFTPLSIFPIFNVINVTSKGLRKQFFFLLFPPLNPVLWLPSFPSSLLSLSLFFFFFCFALYIMVKSDTLILNHIVSLMSYKWSGLQQMNKYIIWSRHQWSHITREISLESMLFCMWLSKKFVFKKLIG